MCSISLHTCWVLIWSWKEIKTKWNIISRDHWGPDQLGASPPKGSIQTNVYSYVSPYRQLLSLSSWRGNWGGWSPRRWMPALWRCSGRTATAWGEPSSWSPGPRSDCASGRGGAACLRTGSEKLQNKNKTRLRHFRQCLTVYLHKSNKCLKAPFQKL